MDRQQAAELEKHLLAAANAMDRASEFIFALDKEDRAMLAVPLGEIVSCLHFEMLEAVYARYPDLRPPGEPPSISSDLRWDDITLPASVSVADLDQVIFSVMTLRWQKTAMVVAKAMDRCKERALPVGPEVLGARVQALAETGRLEAQGDLRKWRHSEVQLKH